MLGKYNEMSYHTITVVPIYILRFEFSQKEPDDMENTTESCQK